MDQYQTLTYLQAALITNAVYAFSTFFLLWVAFRFAGRLREGGGTLFAKALTTIFGLMIIWQGMLLFAARSLSFSAAAKSLRAIKASGQTLGAQAEAMLSTPFVPAAGVEPQFNIFGDPASVIFWLVVAVMLLGVIWMPVKKAS